VASSSSVPELSNAVRDALVELENQRQRLREIRDLTLGSCWLDDSDSQAPPANEEHLSTRFLETVFDRTVGLTVDRLTTVIGRLEEALEEESVDLTMVS
jgi:hypothetical protein